MQIDNQLRQATGRGLKHFQQAADVRARGPWATWPLLSVSTDQGSVEEGAKHFAQQVLRLNLDGVADFAHGCWNDCKRALHLSGWWPFVGLMMVTWNVPHGPWAEDVRCSEVVGCLESLFRTTKRPEDSALFMDLLPRMMMTWVTPRCGVTLRRRRKCGRGYRTRTPSRQKVVKLT